MDSLTTICSQPARSKFFRSGTLDTMVDHKIGLWMPMNIRREPGAGFGNGTSRIRLYARYKKTLRWLKSVARFAVRFRGPVNTASGSCLRFRGSRALPRSIFDLCCDGYLNLSFIDMATGVFSHAGSWIANAGEAFKHVDRIECVGLLHLATKSGRKRSDSSWRNVVDLHVRSAVVKRRGSSTARGNCTNSRSLRRGGVVMRGHVNDFLRSIIGWGIVIIWTAVE